MKKVTIVLFIAIVLDLITGYVHKYFSGPNKGYYFWILAYTSWSFVWYLAYVQAKLLKCHSAIISFISAWLAICIGAIVKQVLKINTIDYSDYYFMAFSFLVFIIQYYHSSKKYV